MLRLSKERTRICCSLKIGVIWRNNKEVHVAGGQTLYENYLGRRHKLERPFLADSHSHPVPDAVLDLLDHTLRRQKPAAIILERDKRLDAVDEILDDVARIRARVAA